MIPMNLRNIANLNIDGVYYCCIVNGTSKSETLNLLQNADLIIKRWIL